MSLKICKKCAVEKPIHEFGVRSIMKSGISNVCKKCNSEASKNWATKNPEKKSSMMKNWRSENKEAIAVYGSAYREENADRIKESASEYRAANKENKKLKAAEWYSANTQLACKLASIWRRENPEKAKQMTRNWRIANPEAVKLIHQNRRARKRQNGGVLSKGLGKKLFKIQRGMCPCCKQPLGDDYELDHIHPIALGGSNTDENIQLLRKQCNRQKRAKHPIDFMQERGFLL